MYALILRRLLCLVPLLLAISFLAFCLTAASPSDPAEVALRVNDITPTPEVIEKTRQELGLDRPFFERYLAWLGKALQGDLGTSFVTHRPVARELARALPSTLALACVATLVVLGVGIPCAIVCFVREGRLADILVRALIFLGAATPTFWAGLLFIWLFAVHLNLLPTGGLEGASSFILPACTLALPSLATYTRLLRAGMLATGQQDFVLYARAQGRSPLAILLQIVRNSLQSTLAALGMTLPKLLAGTFVVECIFAWPGLGRLCVTAIFNRDLPVIQAYVVLMGLFFVLFNLFMEVAGALVDPRLSGRGSAGRKGKGRPDKSRPDTSMEDRS